MDQVIYSVSYGKHEHVADSATEALNWLTAKVQPDRAPFILARVTFTDDKRLITTDLLAYGGHKRKSKLKQRNHKRGLRKEIKRRRKQKRGKLR
jgi:hypothetical protein